MTKRRSFRRRSCSTRPRPDEVTDDDGGVAVAAEQLLAEVPLTQRPVMQEGLQDAELPDGQAGVSHDAGHPGGDRVGRPHQLDVRLESRGLGRSAWIAGRHG